MHAPRPLARFKEPGFSGRAEKERDGERIRREGRYETGIKERGRESQRGMA